MKEAAGGKRGRWRDERVKRVERLFGWRQLPEDTGTVELGG